MSPEAIAKVVKALGVRNSKTDKDLVYVTPQEERLLHSMGGSGRIDPTTGLQHYDDGDGSNGEGSDGYSGGDSSGSSDNSQNNDFGGSDPGGGTFGSADEGTGNTYSDPSEFDGSMINGVYDAATAQSAQDAKDASYAQNLAAHNAQFGQIGPGYFGTLNTDFDFSAPGGGATGLGQNQTDVNAVNSAKGNIADATFWHTIGNIGAKAAGALGGPVVGTVAGLVNNAAYNHFSDPSNAFSRGEASQGSGPGSWGSVSGLDGDTGMGTGDAEVTDIAHSGGGGDGFSIHPVVAPQYAYTPPTYGQYIPAQVTQAGSGAASPASPSVTPAPWYIPDGNIGGPQMAGNDPIDAVDYLQRQKQQAIQQALLQKANVPTQSFDHNLSGLFDLGNTYG